MVKGERLFKFGVIAIGVVNTAIVVWLIFSL